MVVSSRTRRSRVSAGAFPFVSDVNRSQNVGLLGLAFSYLACLTLISGAFSLLAARHKPPSGLAMLGFRRVPVLVIGLLSLLISGYISRDDGLHNAVVKDHGHKHSPVEVGKAFEKWTGAQGNQNIRSLIIVSASGGGIRAATWTSLVLNCVFDLSSKPNNSGGECPNVPWSSWFAGGGASGGSVGLASIVAQQREGVTGASNASVMSAPKWIEDSLGKDHVSALVGTQVFREGVAVVVRAELASDRTRQLEKSWQASFPKSKGSDFFGGATKAPWLSFNSTNAADGCRVNISALRLSTPENDRLNDPSSEGIGGCDVVTRLKGNVADDVGTVTSSFSGGTHDLNQVLCSNQDISLATAAFLSARFPFVSSAGRVESCSKNDGGTLSLVDGGYRENSGAAPMADVVDQLLQHLNSTTAKPTTCFRPVLIEIENGYSGIFGGESHKAPPFESLVPIFGAVGSFGTETKQAPARLRASVKLLAQEFRQRCPNEKPSDLTELVVHFSLTDEPGVRAPLGWSLSKETLERMNDQLRFNCPQLNALAKLAGKELECKK
jgi:hypothetical protein